jgi:hypothetical protein
LLAVLAAAFVITLIVTKIARYVSEAALIRMVGEYENTGEHCQFPGAVPRPDPVHLPGGE